MSRLAGARCLVTGASGFVGRHVCAVLHARGAACTGVGLDPPAAPLPGLEWRTADLLDPTGLAEAVQDARPDVVVHLAGQASAGQSFRAPEATFAVNATGTAHLLEAIRRHAPAARVLAIGSGEAYGPQPEGTRVAEDAPFRPVSPYALSKAVADHVAAAYAGVHGLDVVRTRSFSHTGRGQTPGFALPSFAQQIARIERGAAEPLLRVGNLEVVRDILDVRDVAEGYTRLLEAGERGAAYNVCSGSGVRLSDVVARLTALATVPVRVEVDPARLRAADVPYLVGDPDRMERATGWTRRYALDDTLHDLLDGWREAAPEV